MSFNICYVRKLTKFLVKVYCTNLGIILAVFRCKLLKIRYFCVSLMNVSDSQFIKGYNFARKRQKDREGGGLFEPPPCMVQIIFFEKTKKSENEKRKNKIFRRERKCKCVVVFLGR